MEELDELDFDIDFFRGCHQPPTQQEYMFLYAYYREHMNTL
jgi:hypothetical protein